MKKRMEQALREQSGLSPLSSPPRDAPGEVDLSELLLIHDQEQFLREAYRRILRREIDPSGFFSYSRLLKENFPRVAILRAIASSEEASRTGLKYVGIDFRSGSFRTAGIFRIFPFIERLGSRVYSRLVSIYRSAFVLPVELIDKKLDYILGDLIGRSDRLSGKVDESIGALRAELRETGLSIAAALQEERAQTQQQWQRLQAGMESRLLSADRTLASVLSALRQQAIAQNSQGKMVARQMARLGDHVTKEITALRARFEEALDHAVQDREELRQRMAALDAEVSSRTEAIECGLAALSSSIGEEAAKADSLEMMITSRMTRLEGLIAKEALGLREAFSAASDLAVREREELRQKMLVLDECMSALRAELIALGSKVNAVAEAQQSGVGACPGALAPSLTRSISGAGPGLDSQESAYARYDLCTPRPVVRINDAIVVTELEGHLIAMPSVEWRLVAYYAFKGFPEPGLLKTFRSMLRPGIVVVDVGAHLGIYTLEAARALKGHGRIYSFEPTPSTFALLVENIQLNGYRESGIVVARPEAVLDKSDRALLHIFPGNSGHNTLFRSSECDRTEEVATITLDEALSGESEVHVVKIDAEGAEPFILRGMREVLARSPSINVFIEFAATHLRRAGVEPREFLEEIGAMGFEIAIVDDLTGEAVNCDSEALIRRHSSNLWLRLK